MSRSATAPTLHLCAECGADAEVGRGIDENGHVRWLCLGHFEEDLQAMKDRIERAFGRDT